MNKELAVKNALEIFGFRNINNQTSQDFAIYKAVLKGIYTVEGLGKAYFEKNTTLGPGLKGIVYKYAKH